MVVERGTDERKPIEFQYEFDLFGDVRTKIVQPEDSRSPAISLTKVLINSYSAIIVLAGLQIGTMAAAFINGDIPNDRIPTAEMVDSL